MTSGTDSWRSAFSGQLSAAGEHKELIADAWVLKAGLQKDQSPATCCENACSAERTKRARARKSWPGRATGRVLDLGGIFQLEGYFHVGLIALDVPILDHDVHVLDPRAFHASERLGGAGDGLVDGVLEAVSDVALSSVTRAKLIVLASFDPDLPLV